jgi:hypothetical protein
MEDFEKIKAIPNFTIIGHMTQESEDSFSDSCKYKNCFESAWVGCIDAIKRIVSKQKRHSCSVVFFLLSLKILKK